MSHWTTADIPSQAGRTAVITGTGGIGYEIALGLAGAGADVVIAGRNPAKGTQAVTAVRRVHPAATVRFEAVDLADLRSIAGFATRLRQRQDGLDILVNNAGVMLPPSRQVTADGFEVQFGVNYLGHFALTGQLLPLLTRAAAPRVVTLGSVGARGATIDFANLNAEGGYHARRAYGQSKLACLLFARELQRKNDENNWGLVSLAAHPGVSRTDLLLNAPGRFSFDRIARLVVPFMFQPVAQGALPVLYAATAEGIEAGGYYGPDRMGETRGGPAPARYPPAALEVSDAERLWTASTRLTGTNFRC
jgi:NAD(P)-dependent dehydrogenase (short-subunit alcohol dehydrogenase family)